MPELKGPVCKFVSLQDGLVLEFYQIHADSLKLSVANVTVEPGPGHSLLVGLDLQLEVVLGLRNKSMARRRGKPDQGGDWQLILDSLAGRLSLKLYPADWRLTAKLEGWPQLDMRLAPTEPDSQRSRPESLAEVIKKIAAQALRCCQIDIK